MIDSNGEALFALETFACVLCDQEGWGRICMLSFPGLQLGHDGRTYIKPEDMVSVLTALQRAGVSKLILLPKRSELPPGADIQLSKAARAYQLEASRLPVVDFSIPDRKGEALWNKMVPELTDVLASGSGVAFSCLSGVGRSSAFAARMLCELGATQQEAISTVRKVLPSAIETLEQEQWVGQAGQTRRNKE